MIPAATTPVCPPGRMRKLALFLVIVSLSYIFWTKLGKQRPSSNLFLGKNSQSSYRKSSSPSVNIAVIGSSGYIGSRLLQHLRDDKNANVIGYDRIFRGQASDEISTGDLRQFGVVIYLGGLTGRVMCRDRPTEVQRENVDDISALAKRMLPDQLLIYASTSAIAEGSGSVPIDEDAPVQSHLFDTYTASLWRRENALRKLSIASKSMPQMVGLRFGTVIGLSQSQRIDLSHMAFVCQAFRGSRLAVTHPEAYRGLLWMEDLLRAITRLILRSKDAKRFDIFHLQSFSSSIAKIASSISAQSGAYIHAFDHPIKEDSRGFSLNATKFSKTFDFVFEGDQDKMIAQLIDDVPRMCLGRQSRIDNGSIPCVVCGSKTMHVVLDLHTQPLANDFRVSDDQAMKCERYPLRLVRCPRCHHTQLSQVVDRGYLFSHYLYQSGTSGSLKAYFEWLAEKVIDESSTAKGTVIEVACNDGSQLNQFYRRGWTTFGVDPAKNLAELARAQNHTVFTGFWGTETFPGLPRPESVDAILAQNVLAHVEDPVRFMRACAAVMSPKTRLYIQTSQCEMYDTGQFDTVYHEHVSFFTAHSFQKIAELVGLKIVNFEITPIHGRSCLVTFKRMDSSNASFVPMRQQMRAPPLKAALQKEEDLGMSTAWFYVKYEAQALSMRAWIARQLHTLHLQGHTIVAYGAAAKGMVLLHFLLEIPNRLWDISYVVDDAPLKQNTFCPGTRIPVRPTSDLGKHNASKPLTIIVFAWNFWNEISKKIAQETVKKGQKRVFLIRPFPQQQLVRLDGDTHVTLVENMHHATPWPTAFPVPRLPVVLISHFYNEEFLLPFWIRHHASMFDLAILIDYNSTDRSAEIIRNEAPSSWKVITSRNREFQHAQVDAEVMDYERTYPRAWKIALNTPEFLVHPNLRAMLANVEKSSDTKALRFRCVIMSGNDSLPLQRFSSLLKQRSQYSYASNDDSGKHAISSYSRFLHRYPAVQYGGGRHDISGSASEWSPLGFIAKYKYTPWPGIKQRKLQIRSRVPLSDFQRGAGTQHNVNAEQLEREQSSIQALPQKDLADFVADSIELAMVHRLWREVLDE